MKRKNESEDYFDSQPRQTSIVPPDDETGIDDEPQEKMFKVDLSLTICSDIGRPHKINLYYNDQLRGALLHEVLGMAIKTRHNRQIIDAFLDLPSKK